MSWKRQMNESFRGQTLITYYKEDLVNVLREFYTLEMLQEVLHIDDRNKDKLVEILRTGLKKEELNVILFNSQNITSDGQLCSAITIWPECCECCRYDQCF